jgi:hypothetical protein
MPQANWVIFLHFIALWGSVITSTIAGWRLPISWSISLPLGLVLWASGFLYNLYTIKQAGRGRQRSGMGMARRSYQRIFARVVMNLGVGLSFGSWLTMIAGIALAPFYVSAARKRMQYLDYMRTGMLSDAFPDRITRH